MSDRWIVVVVWMTLTLIKWVGISVAKRSIIRLGEGNPPRRDGINSERESVRDVFGRNVENK